MPAINWRAMFSIRTHIMAVFKKMFRFWQHPDSIVLMTSNDTSGIISRQNGKSEDTFYLTCRVKLKKCPCIDTI